MTNSYAQDQARPTLTVDVIIPNEQGQVLVIRRGHAPYEGLWCLPGGLVDAGEMVEAAAVREVKEETGLDVTIARVHGIYSKNGRDPRGHYVSITLVAHVVEGTPQVTEEATEWQWVEPKEKLEMAFDHARILADHAERRETNAVLA